MDYETEEQQVEALKAWWDENGKSVIAGVVIGALAIGGWTGFRKYQEGQAVAASDVFSRVAEAVQGNNVDQAQSLAAEAADDHKGSLYAAYASMMAARASVAEGDLVAAAEQLQWASENAVQDDVKLIASVRLARVGN